MLDVEVDLVGDLWSLDGLCRLSEKEEDHGEDEKAADDKTLELKHFVGSIYQDESEKERRCGRCGRFWGQVEKSIARD